MTSSSEMQWDPYFALGFDFTRTLFKPPASRHFSFFIRSETYKLSPNSYRSNWNDALKFNNMHFSFLIAIFAIQVAVVATTHPSSSPSRLLHIQVSAGDESRMAGDGGVLYGRRRRYLVWPEMTVDSDTGWWHSAVLALSYILALWPS